MPAAASSWATRPIVRRPATWLEDWWNGTAEIGTWLPLAWYDISLRYRRSLLGPWWITISMGMMLLGLGPLYATLFGLPMRAYFPGVAIGMVFWNFMSTTLNDGSSVFIASSSYLKNSDMPISLFSWRCVARHVIQLLHHMVLYIPFAVWAGVPLTLQTLLFFPGLLLLVFNMHAAVIWIGMACARFRDVGQIVTSTMTFMTFLTPIIWSPDSLPERARMVLDLPFAVWLALIREPLLGRAAEPRTWLIALAWTAVNAAIASVMFSCKRRQLVYWV
jgi:lipopolysaccharide transport system permease protein